MTDHRPAARSAIRGLIQLLTDHQPRRRQRGDCLCRKSHKLILC